MEKKHFKGVSEELQLTWTPEKKKKLHQTTKYLASVESTRGFKKSEDKLLR